MMRKHAAWLKGEKELLTRKKPHDTCHQPTWVVDMPADFIE